MGMYRRRNRRRLAAKFAIEKHLRQLYINDVLDDDTCMRRPETEISGYSL